MSVINIIRIAILINAVGLAAMLIVATIYALARQEE